MNSCAGNKHNCTFNKLICCSYKDNFVKINNFCLDLEL